MAEHNFALTGTPSIVLNQASATYKVITTPSLLVNGSTPAVESALSNTDGKSGGVVVAQGVYGYVKQTPAYDIDFIVDFLVPVTRLNSINIYYSAGSNYSDDSGVDYSTRCTKKVYVKQAGVYNLKSTVVGMPLKSDSLKNTIHLWTITFDPVEKAVQGIKINASNPYESRSSWYLGFYVSEIQAMGVVYEDIGLRYYDGSAVKKIGVEDLDGHKLRVYDGAAVRGIDLISTSRDDASGIRLYDGSSVKALPLID